MNYPYLIAAVGCFVALLVLSKSIIDDTANVFVFVGISLNTIGILVFVALASVRSISIKLMEFNKETNELAIDFHRAFDDIGGGFFYKDGDTCCVFVAGKDSVKRFDYVDDTDNEWHYSDGEYTLKIRKPKLKGRR